MGDVTRVFSTTSWEWLEPLSWASQVALVLLTIAVVFAALHQASALKLFEILKFIQDENFRKARRTVIVNIGPVAGADWW